MAILQTGTNYSDGDQVTSTNLNNAVNGAAFTADAADNLTTQISSGKIAVKDGGITAAKLESASNGQLMIGNGSGFDLSSLTAGSGIGIVAGAGSIEITSTGSMGGSSGSTDNAIIRADGTGGNTIQSSGITIDDSNNIAGANNITASNLVNVASTNGYQVNGTKVLGAQGTAIPDLNSIHDSGDFSGSQTADLSAIASAFQDTDDKIDTILAALRTHGIIAT